MYLAINRLLRRTDKADKHDNVPYRRWMGYFVFCPDPIITGVRVGVIVSWAPDVTFTGLILIIIVKYLKNADEIC